MKKQGVPFKRGTPYHSAKGKREAALFVMSKTNIRQVPAQQIRMKRLVARHIRPYVRLAAACAAVSCVVYGLMYLFAGKSQPGMWLFIVGAGVFLFIVLLAILLYAFPLDWLRIVYQQRVLG